MPRLNVIQPEQASPPVRQIYDDLTAKMGKVVNIFQGMANSPAALRAYLAMSAALAEGEQPKRWVTWALTCRRGLWWRH